MKMRVTVDQVNQLTPEQRDKLRILIEPQEGNYLLHKGEEYLFVHKNRYGYFLAQNDRDMQVQPLNKEEFGKVIVLLSTGQCIELLHESIKGRDNNRISLWEFPSDGWNVETLDITDSKWGDKHIWIKNKNELIDALWEAVKSILQDNDHRKSRA